MRSEVPEDIQMELEIPFLGAGSRAKATMVIINPSSQLGLHSSFVW